MSNSSPGPTIWYGFTFQWHFGHLLLDAYHLVNVPLKIWQQNKTHDCQMETENYEIQSFWISSYIWKVPCNMLPFGVILEIFWQKVRLLVITNIYGKPWVSSPRLFPKTFIPIHYLQCLKKKKKVPKSRHEVRENWSWMSHHLFQESKNCKLGIFFFNNAKYQRTPGQDLFPTLCPTLNKTMSQFSGFKQPGSASDVQALSVFFFFVSTHSSFLYSVRIH